MTKVKCKRCAGTGSAAHRTARLDARCFCCGGLGYYHRKPATKRKTEQQHLDEFNARLAALYPNSQRADDDDQIGDLAFILASEAGYSLSAATDLAARSINQDR